jgi:hypothetical protein
MIPILALIGLITVRRNGGAPKWRALFPVLALLLYFTLIHALTHAEARLSEPLQPFLLILLAGAVGRMGWQRKNEFIHEGHEGSPI